MSNRRSVEKRLLRRRRAQALERSYQLLKRAILHATLVSAGAVALSMLLQLLTWPAPASPASGSLAKPILRHYALLIPVLMTSFFGAAFAFRFLAPVFAVALWRLLVLGALFGLAAHLSFFPAVDFAGAVGGIVWLLLLAMSITYAGILLSQRGG